MFVDYITLMLMNMVAGLVVLAAFFVVGFGKIDHRAWAPPLAVVGLVALGLGFHMTLTWPVTEMTTDSGTVNLRWANVAWGEMTILFGTAYLAAGVALAGRWRLHGVGVFGLVAGATAIAVGAGVGKLGLSNTPTLTAVGFFLTGGGGVLALAAILWPRLWLRIVVAAALLGGAGIWTVIGIGAYWSHLARFSGKM